MKNRTYKFTYLDREDNELHSCVVECVNIKDARKTAKAELANSNENDLYKIKVKRIY